MNMSMEIGTHDPRDYPEPQSYGVMPDKLAARGDRGWLPDDDRDSTQAVALRGLVDNMDRLARDWATGQPVTVAEVMALWVAIRQITQGRNVMEGQG